MPSSDLSLVHIKVSCCDEILKETEFKNKFKEVVFAILDKDGEKGKFAPFYKMFN